MSLKVDSPVESICNIVLKKHIPRRKVEVSQALNFQAELALAYEDLGDHSAIPNRSPSFFEYASFFIKEDNDIVQYCLYVGDVVSINMEELIDRYAIIRIIFCHQKNDRRFAFIVIDWFEDTNQTKLGCLVYRLRKINNYRKIFSISVVSTVNTVHFVHNCKDECIEGNHDFRNDLY
jgi:hypothetical protein